MGVRRVAGPPYAQSTTSNPYQQYQAVAVETASPLQLVVMLYDGAIRFCTQAEEAVRRQNREMARERIDRVQAILAELMSTLNMEAGGEVAQNLYRVYEFSMYRLVQAQLHQNPDEIADVSRLLRELREAWAEIARRPKVADAGAEG